MHFRTEIILPETQKKISYRKELMMIGSCFAETVGSFVSGLLFNISINPFGIQYNPASVASGLELILNNEEFDRQSLFYANGLWNNFNFHSKFSDPEISGSLKKMNESILKNHQILQQASHLFITFGTSCVYIDNASGNVVNNCHKLPAKNFERVYLSVREMEKIWLSLIDKLKNFNPDLHFVFTISPIRHLADGAYDNQVSKSSLFLLIDALKGQLNPSSFTYFPSYEIVMDELRDYRFYAQDMVHLSDSANQYIQEKFEELFFDQESRIISAQIQKILKSLSHKPFHPSEKLSLDFSEKLKSEVKQLSEKFNFLKIDSLIDDIDRKYCGIYTE